MSANFDNAPKYPKSLIELVTQHYRSGKFAESWRARRVKDEEHFNHIHPTCFPFVDIWDEISAKKGRYSNRASLVRVYSADDGWPIDICEHFGRLAMSISARAEILQKSADLKSIEVERERELSLIESFYGCLSDDDQWPHCALIACNYLLEMLPVANPGPIYSDDFD